MTIRNYHKESGYMAQKKYDATHKKIVLKCDHETYARLSSFAQTEGVTIQEVIRRALAVYIER